VQIETLVDVVPPAYICTKLCQIKSLDIATVTKDQLSFTAAFRLPVTRDDYLTAVVLSFDVCFSHCTPPLLLSTSPRAQYTHWRQSIFYLPDPLTVAKTRLSCC